MEVIASFFFLGKTYCSVSWGKDSTVTAFFAAQLNIPIVYVKSNRANPDSDFVRDAFIEQFNPIYEEISIELDPLDRGEVIGNFFDGVKSKHGDRRITGIRAQESANRKMSAKIHGVSTDKSCRPVLDWTIDDIFAYLLHQDLPIHPVYALSNNAQFARHELRVDVLGDILGKERGREEWEKLYYPQEYKKHQEEIRNALNHT